VRGRRARHSQRLRLAHRPVRLIEGDPSFPFVGAPIIFIYL
jgi:hypothetical protein